MGSSTSKAARTASNTVRKYPSRISPQTSASRTTNAPSTRPTAETSTGPTVHPQTQASGSKDNAIMRDASDPDLAFNARLSQLGPVQPSPTLSHSSVFNTSTRIPASTPRARGPAESEARQASPAPATSSNSSFKASASAPSQTIFPSPASNPAVMVLTARTRLAQEAEEQFENLGRKGSPGRGFLDVVTIREVLMLRDERRMGAEEIEKMLGLRKGVVEKLGPRGLFMGAGA